MLYVPEPPTTLVLLGMGCLGLAIAVEIADPYVKSAIGQFQDQCERLARECDRCSEELRQTGSFRIYLGSEVIEIRFLGTTPSP